MVEGLFMSTEMNLGNTSEKKTETRGVELRQQQELEDLLSQYADIFREPKGLPPSRGRNML